MSQGTGSRSAELHRCGDALNKMQHALDLRGFGVAEPHW